MANVLYGRCEANKPISIQHGSMTMVFAPAQFWPTQWLAKNRVDFSYKLKSQLRIRLKRNDAGKILRQFDQVSKKQVSYFSDDQYKLVLFDRIKVAKIKVYYISSYNMRSVLLSDSYLSVNCRSASSLELYDKADLKAQREKLTIELSQILVERRANTLRLDDIYWSRWWITRMFIVTGSVLYVFAQGIAALGTLVIIAVVDTFNVLKAINNTFAKLLGGDFLAVQRDLQKLSGGVVQELDEMKASIRKGYEIASTIWGDEQSRKLLFAFMKEYVDGTSVVDSATFKISLTVDILLVLGTLGAGAVVVGARLAHRVGQFTVRALQFIVELWRALKLLKARRIIEPKPPIKLLPAPKVKSGGSNGNGNSAGTSGTGNGSSSKPDFIGTSNGDMAKISDLTPSKKKAVERELRVAEIVGGKSATRSRIREKDGKLIVEDTPVIKDGQVVTGVDVFGKNGELIQVGGPGKNANDVVFEKTKKALNALKEEAQNRGTKAQVYYEQGNSDRFRELIKESQNILGKENVFILPN